MRTHHPSGGRVPGGRSPTVTRRRRHPNEGKRSMFKLSDSVAFRRTVTGVLLFVAPLLQFVALLVDPGTWGDDREMVSYGDNPALAQLESALYHWSWMLVPIAAFGLLHLVRKKAVILGHIAGGMTIIGYIS